MFERQTDAFIDYCALQGHEEGVAVVAFSPDSKLLLSRSYDYKFNEWSVELRVWSVEKRKTKHIFHTSQYDIIPRFLPDGNLVAASMLDTSIVTWDMKTGEKKNELKIGSHYLQTFSPDGSLMASTKNDKSIRLWYTETGEPKFVIERSRRKIDNMTFSPNGKLVALIRRDGKIKLKNTENGFEERIFKKGPLQVRKLTFSPNGRVIALADDYQALWLWDREEKQAKCVSIHRGYYRRGMIFSPNGKWVTSKFFHDTERIILWNTEQENEHRIFENHSDIMDVTFSPDSRFLALASKDGIVGLWDVDKRKELGILKAHAGAVRDVAFSPDGEFVATASDNRLVGLWNVSQWTK